MASLRARLISATMEAADKIFEDLGQANGASHNLLFDEEEEEGLQW